MKLYVKTGSTEETKNFLEKMYNDDLIPYLAYIEGLRAIDGKVINKAAISNDTFDVNKLLEFFLNSRNYNYMMWIEDEEDGD